MTRVLVTTFWDLDRPSGFTNNVHRDVEAMKRALPNAEVVVSAHTPFEEEPEGGVDEYVLDRRDARLLGRTLQRALQEPVDVLWVNSMRVHYSAFLAASVRARRPGAGIAYRAQDPVSFMYRRLVDHQRVRATVGGAVAHAAERTLIRVANTVVAVGDGMFSVPPFPRARHREVLYNVAGVRQDDSPPGPQEARDGLTLGYLGLAQRNVRGLERQLEIYRRYLDLRGERAAFGEFLLLGNGTPEDLAHFRSLIRDLKLEGHVTMLPGPVPWAEMENLLRRVDAAMLEPSSIHLPSKFFEYLHHGVIPFVNEGSTEMRRVLDAHGHPYATVDYEDVEASARSLARFEEAHALGNPGAGAKLAEQGRALVREHLEHNAATYERVLRKLAFP